LGKLATKILASGDGWWVGDVVCTAGPADRPFEEQHDAVSIAVVVEGSFQYRSECSSAVLSPGSLLLGSYGQTFECGHEHGAGDRCVAFHYAPEFFERAAAGCAFPVHRIPPIAALAPWVVQAQLGLHAPRQPVLEELAHGLAGAVLGVLGTADAARPASAADERRVSAVLRFIEAHLSEPLPLERLASIAQMSAFHFLRVFKQVLRVTPHQYILRARLREAATWLQTRPDAVLDIALDTGFEDLSNFHHAFRAEFGVTPRAYRRHKKGSGRSIR
jgi:AraC-like DNA-binding protein